jgi:hypothetical protein
MKKVNIRLKKEEEETSNDLPGYPVYPGDEDIYAKDKEEKDIDPEDISEKKKSPREGKPFVDDLEFDESGNDLDIPGSELDDKMEDIGSGDEENNFYSIGDENYDELEDIDERI